jgi:hypothetical protein
MTNIEVSEQEFDALVARGKARQATFRLRKFAGKRERSFQVYVVTVPTRLDTAITGAQVTREWRTVRGFTLADAKEQAGIE